MKCFNDESRGKKFSCRVYRGNSSCPDGYCPNRDNRVPLVPDNSGIITEIHKTLYDAKIKHPEFPKDIIHMIAVMAEESGEAVRAALLHHYEGGSIEDVQQELYQTAAMCIRVLEELENGK